jgi:GNAT superfamily N-acetyltransferase
MTVDKPSGPPVHALLADGTTVRIRPVTAHDREQLRGLYEEMSTENLRMRFFGASRRSAEMAADRACAAPRPGYRALLAERAEQVIGLAEYDTGGTGTEADISIAVADGLHHRGVGTLLVEHLVSAARAEGVTAFTADALSENREVLRLFADKVFLRPDADIRTEVVDEVLVHALWLPPRSIGVSVTEGVVTLTGHMDRKSEKEIALSMTRQIDGVVAVVDKLTFRLDDARIQPEEQALHGVADDWLRGL